MEVGKGKIKNVAFPLLVTNVIILVGNWFKWEKITNV